MSTHRIHYRICSLLRNYFKQVNTRGRAAVARYCLYKGYSFVELAGDFDIKDVPGLLDDCTEYYIKEIPLDPNCNVSMPQEDMKLELWCWNRHVEDVVALEH